MVPHNCHPDTSWQEDCKVETSLGYRARSYSQGNPKKGKEEGEGKEGKGRGEEGRTDIVPTLMTPDLMFYRHRGNHPEPIPDSPTGRYDLSTFPIEGVLRVSDGKGHEL